MAQATGRLHRLLFSLTLAGALLAARPAGAFSVVAHLEAIDASWDRQLAALLEHRFGRLTPAQLREARAYAYGGALIQDLGYYPFGSHFFTNLTHYVRSGEFVDCLIRDAEDPDEYAFALGALAHYAFDNAGHPLAVNRAVPMMYPKVRAKVGPTALYVDSPPRHLMVEFAYDVLQVARGDYLAQDYRDRIGFQVSKPLLSRAFQQTYGLTLDDVFTDVDLAIGTYRHAVSTTIPDLTRVAWKEKHDEIVKRTPDISEKSFVYALTRQEYEHDYGVKYRKPSFLARTIGLLYKILPKVGPLKPLAFEPLTADVEAMFNDSVAAARSRYRTALAALGAGHLRLADTDFDTGRAREAGVNRLADKTYAEWRQRLAKRQPTAPSPGVARVEPAR
jgi:hypothetical protein